MENYVRSTTFEVPFDNILTEPGVNWWRDAVPTHPDSGPRRIAKTHGEDDILTAVHRDRPSIGLVSPMPEKDGEGSGSGQAPHCTQAVPGPNISDIDETMYIHVIRPYQYRTFGVYEDDCGDTCLVVAIHKSTFSAKPSKQQPAERTGPQKSARSQNTSNETNICPLDAAHKSDHWMRFLFYSHDLVIAESMDALEVGQWCLMDEGHGHFLEASLSPNLEHVQISLTRPVHTAMNVPYAALVHRQPDADISDTDFKWLQDHMANEPDAENNRDPRLFFGPARHPLLAAVHHDQPTIAISWPAERSDGAPIDLPPGKQLVDVFVFKPHLYQSGGLWLDEELQTCLPLFVTFYEADKVDKRGWATEGAHKDAETGVVLLYPQNRVDNADSIKEWGEWALLDPGKGVGLVQSWREYPRCEEAPVYLRPLPWGGQRCWV